LAVLRHRGGKKVPPHLQRFRAEDLLTAVFPMQTACFEHRTGDLEPPDHPLVRQTVHDCLQEVMDFKRFLGVLNEIEAGRIELVARDTREPSPFSHQLVNSNPYTFLDDAPLEERRARAVSVRRSFRADDVRDLGRLDPAAIEQVKAEAWPVVRDVEELHDALMSAGALPATECVDWHEFFTALQERGRAAECAVVGGPKLWIAVERWPAVKVAVKLADETPPATLPANLSGAISLDDARMMLVRGRLEICGPVTAKRIAADLGMSETDVQIALEQLELAGFLLRGQFTRPVAEVEWCERRLLARIHRLTLDGLRRQVAPVDTAAFMRYLLARHDVTTGTRPVGSGGLQRIMAMLQGFDAPAGAWEHELLPVRMEYDGDALDQLFSSGELAWGRLNPPRVAEEGRGQMLTRVSPITVFRRNDLAWLLPIDREVSLGAARWDAQQVYEALTSHGALFFSDLLAAPSLLPSQLEDALRELAALGLVSSDGFSAVRAISTKTKHEVGRPGRRSRRQPKAGAYARGGRWSKFPPFVAPVERDERTEKWAWQLLQRYGVMFRDLLAREGLAPTWGELARVYRRMEMRGEIRGGRFVSGVAGEQFALPEAVELLRKQRDEPAQAEWAVISAADPLNLVGILTVGLRVPALRSNRVAFLNGRALAAREGRELRWLADVDEGTRMEAERLLRRPGPLRPAAAQEPPAALAITDW
jgi:ATP-dependent Lhr-like helicase